MKYCGIHELIRKDCKLKNTLISFDVVWMLLCWLWTSWHYNYSVFCFSTKTFLTTWRRLQHSLSCENMCSTTFKSWPILVWEMGPSVLLLYAFRPSRMVNWILIFVSTFCFCVQCRSLLSAVFPDYYVYPGPGTNTLWQYKISLCSLSM
jgi:hypothetical protein